MTTLHALMNGEHLGVLDGQGRQLRFRYDQDLDPADTVPLSLSAVGALRHLNGAGDRATVGT